MPILSPEKLDLNNNNDENYKKHSESSDFNNNNNKNHGSNHKIPAFGQDADLNRHLNSRGVDFHVSNSDERYFYQQDLCHQHVHTHIHQQDMHHGEMRVRGHGLRKSGGSDNEVGYYVNGQISMELPLHNQYSRNSNGREQFYGRNGTGGGQINAGMAGNDAVVSRDGSSHYAHHDGYRYDSQRSKHDPFEQKFISLRPEFERGEFTNMRGRRSDGGVLGDWGYVYAHSKGRKVRGGRSGAEVRAFLAGLFRDVYDAVC
jgi:hypothetical protein